MKHLVLLTALIGLAGPARADCDFSHIDGHENNQWTVGIDVRAGTYSQALDTDKSQTKSGTATIACEDGKVAIRQTSATAGSLCAYDLKREGASIGGTYTCQNVGGGHTFSGLTR